MREQRWFDWAMMASIFCVAILMLLSPVPVSASWPTVSFPSDKGIILTKGFTYTIQWHSIHVDPLSIELCTEVAVGEIDCFYNVAVGVPNSGSYSWTVPNNLPNGVNYVIGVGITGVSYATSVNTFTISDALPDAFWALGSWGDCSASCGGGYKTRSVQCQDLLGNVVPEIYCPGTKPPSVIECNIDACPKGIPWLMLLLD